jgi:hypothetical protein
MNRGWRFECKKRQRSRVFDVEPHPPTSLGTKFGCITEGRAPQSGYCRPSAVSDRVQNGAALARFADIADAVMLNADAEVSQQAKEVAASLFDYIRGRAVQVDNDLAARADSSALEWKAVLR